MKTRIAVLLFVAITAGVFAFTRTKNARPSDLRDAVAFNEPAKTYECGLMVGLLPAAAALGITPGHDGSASDMYINSQGYKESKGYDHNSSGGPRYLGGIYEERLRTGNLIAGGIAEIAQNISVTTMLKLQLEEISRVILTVTKPSIYSNSDGWNEALAAQKRTFQQAGKSIENLSDLVCSGAAN